MNRCILCGADFPTSDTRLDYCPRCAEFGPCAECGSTAGNVADAPICQACWDSYQPKPAPTSDYAVIIEHQHRAGRHCAVLPCATGGYEPDGAGRVGIGVENDLAAAGWRQYTGLMWEPGWDTDGVDYGVFFVWYRNPDGSITNG